MAEKENNSTQKNTAKATVKVTAKPASSTAKPAATAKPASAPKPTTAASVAPKTSAAAKPAVSVKPATAKPTTAATVAPKTAATPKPVAASAQKPVAAKPAESTAKSATSAKPVAATKATAAAPKAMPVEEKPQAVKKEEHSEEVKKEKPVKKEKSSKAAKSEGGSTAKARAVAIVKSDNFKIFGIIGLSLILVLCLCLGLIFGLKSCTGINGVLKQDSVTVNAYAQTTMVGYSSKTVGTVSRNKPVQGLHDEREMFSLGDTIEANIANGTTELARLRYPKYGSTMNSVVGTDADGSKANARTVLINESDYLTAYGTHNNSGNGNNGAGTYNMMDKDGYLYFVNNGTITPATYDNGTHRRLYQHTASVGMYLGNVSDDEPGIIKQVTLRPRGYTSYSVTGVYAPAGEVIKIELSDADMTATGGITIHIGQALYNGQSNNIWTAKGQMQRFPNILNTMVVNTSTAEFNEETGMWTAYVGSFIGGPLYVRNTSATVSVKISGGVNYRHFILGYTSPEEFAELSKSSVPYFDLEVWDRGVLHSGPLTYAKTFSYDDLYKAAVLWEKVSLVSNNNGDGANCNRGIVFLYDPFVAAGAAVAFPGRNSVNCPMGWMSSSLNYNATVTSGSWGNFHEYNHNFQNYGIGYTGEITNNGLNLVSYSLFTNISSARQLASYGGAGLSGWNCYTSATWVQRQVMTNNINSTSHLAVYANLLHNFGQENFLNARGYSNVNYLNRWATITHQDFSYFDQNSVPSTGSQLNPAETDYPLFVPVSSVYQTGRTYMYDGEKREINTMQPYVIPYGQPFTVDLRPYTVNGAGQYESGSIFLGASTENDFTYKIKGVRTDGINGTFVKAGEDGVYTFTPNSEMRSGKIYVTLEIYNSADGTREWNGHKLDDVDLILEFQQSHEWNKAILERTTYVYAEGNVPESASAAFESGYAGNINVVEQDNKNYSQNSNTDIWLYPYNDTYLSNPTYSPYVMTPNSVVEIKGKLYFPEEGKYRIFLRGRQDCVLYISRDGGATYNKAAYIDKTINPSNGYVFFPNNEKTYVDVDVSAEEWIYFKEVVVIKDLGRKTSFVGLGLNSFTVPQYTTVEKHYDANGNEVSSTDDPTYDHSVTHYYKGNQEVSAEEANDVTPVAPTSANYATAYRQNYEFPKEFESDYFILREYNYNYLGDMRFLTEEVTQTYIDGNYVGWNNTEEFVITNLFDGDPDTYIHSGNGNQYMVSESNPAVFTVELSEEISANILRLYPSHGGGSHPAAFPKNFYIEGSLDGETYFEMGRWTGKTAGSTTEYLDFTLSDTFTFKYYRLTVTATNSGTARLALAEIKWISVLSLTGNGNNFFSPDNKMFTYKGNWKVESCNASFGHVYVGKNSTMEFEFEGSRFAILASKYYGQNYEVRIDGQLVESIAVKEDNGDYSVVFLTPELSEGKHSVAIYCPQEGNIDAIAFW